MIAEMLGKMEYDPSLALNQGLERIKAEFPEFGKNVEIVVEIARHGAKTKEGALSEKGMEQAAALGAKFPEASRIIGYASTLEQGGAKRALDTVRIAIENAPEIKEKALASIERIGRDFDFMTLKNAWDLNIFKKIMAEAPEKGWTSEQAEDIGLNETLKACPEAVREVASRFAHWLKFFMNSSIITKNGEKVFYPIISHGIMPESFFKMALVRTNKDTGEKIVGYDDLIEDFGGGFSETEAVDFKAKTDADKNLSSIRVEFKNPERAKIFEGWDLSIDWDKIEELDKEYYEKYQ